MADRPPPTARGDDATPRAGKRAPDGPRPPQSPTPEAETVSPPGEPATIPYVETSQSLPDAAGALRSGAELPELPARFGRYRIERVLGEGGMGAVYLAYDTQLDRRVALKVRRFGRDEGALRDRFLREARAAATLRHPNLCPVFDIDEQDGVYYLTMSYIEGVSLADYLRDKSFSPARAVDLVARLARAGQGPGRHVGPTACGAGRTTWRHCLPGAREHARRRRHRCSRGPVGPGSDHLRLAGRMPAFQRGYAREPHRPGPFQSGRAAHKISACSRVPF